MNLAGKQGGGMQTIRPKEPKRNKAWEVPPFQRTSHMSRVVTK